MTESISIIYARLNNAGNQPPYYYSSGLYYFYTIFTDQARDYASGNGNVSIGFHYYVLFQPYASPVSAQVCRGNSVPITLGGGSPNTPDGSVESYTFLTQPQHGSLSGTAPNLTYTETDPAFLGQDTFTYETFDGYLDSPPASVAITVGDPYPQAYDMGAITTVGQPITLILEGSDICDDPLMFTTSDGPSNGQLGQITQKDATHASVVYTPKPGFAGQDSFAFTVNDEVGNGVGTASASVQISVVSGPIVLVSVNYSLAGPIQTYNFSDGSVINSFVPAGENGYNVAPGQPGPDGRGLAINTIATGTEIFYTQVGDIYGGTHFIHVCSYGTDGSGSVTDSRTLPNPDQRTDSAGNSAGIAALTFHIDPNTGKTELYALTGYTLASPYHPEVYELDPASGNIIAGPISIPTPIDPANGLYSSSDGFTVLTSGDFLINDYDGADGDALYREYYGFNPPAGKTPGALVPGGLQIDVSSFSSEVGFNIGGGTGVTCAPDGSLYFMVYELDETEGFNNTAVVHTDSSGNYISSGPVFALRGENIAVVTP
jgi:Bacterial Ig domain